MWWSAIAACAVTSPILFSGNTTAQHRKRIGRPAYGAGNGRSYHPNNNPYTKQKDYILNRHIIVRGSIDYYNKRSKTRLRMPKLYRGADEAAIYEFYEFYEFYDTTATRAGKSNLPDIDKYSLKKTIIKNLS